jgi:DNA anti-recombination protein RmuC
MFVAQEAAVMGKVFWLAVCVATIIFSGSFQGLADEETKVSPEDLKKQAESTFETAKKFAEQQKGEYQKKIESELADFAERIGQLKDRAESATGETLAQLRAKMGDLRERQRAAEGRLGQLKSSTEQAWNEMKDGLDRAVGDLRKAYESAAGFFK